MREQLPPAHKSAAIGVHVFTAPRDREPQRVKTSNLLVGRQQWTVAIIPGPYHVCRMMVA